jgi:hypothetical protein
MYRNRLIRAFLGASNAKDPNRDVFDGFSVKDNLFMHVLKPRDEKWPKQQPFPVLNMTLNVTETDNKAWQERKAASFISTPFHTGGDLVGYWESEKYAGGITLARRCRSRGLP